MGNGRALRSCGSCTRRNGEGAGNPEPVGFDPFRFGSGVPRGDGKKLGSFFAGEDSGDSPGYVCFVFGGCSLSFLFPSALPPELPSGDCIGKLFSDLSVCLPFPFASLRGDIVGKAEIWVRSFSFAWKFALPVEESREGGFGLGVDVVCVEASGFRGSFGRGFGRWGFTSLSTSPRCCTVRLEGPLGGLSRRGCVEDVDAVAFFPSRTADVSEADLFSAERRAFSLDVSAEPSTSVPACLILLNFIFFTINSVAMESSSLR
jgi:hypothetical protein